VVQSTTVVNHHHHHDHHVAEHSHHVVKDDSNDLETKMIAAIAKDKLDEEDHEHRVKINKLAGEALDTINKYCGPYDKDCGTTDNTKMIKLMGKLSNELDNDNVHPGVNNLMNGITINSALHAVYDKNEESDDSDHHHHHSKK